MLFNSKRFKKFTLTTNQKEQTNFTGLVLKNTLNHLKLHKINYIILSPSEAINNCNFIQTCHSNDNKEKFTVEVSISDSKTNRLYGKHNLTIDDVKDIFVQYIDKETVPDISDWESIGEFVNDENHLTPIFQKIINRLNVPYRLLPPDISDEQLMSIYYEEFERGKKEGFTPIIIPEDDYLEDYFGILFDESSYSIEKELKQSESYDGYQLLQEKLSEIDADFASENIDLSQVKGEFEGGQSLNILSTYSTSILLEVPTSKPWETVIYIPFGGWNSCPAPSEMATICRYWNEKYGAVPAVITHDELEMIVPKPVSADDAMSLAMEMYAFCPDCVEQCTKSGNVGEVASTIMKSRVWFFWWD